MNQGKLEMREVRNDGTRCIRCGGYFDDGGTFNCGCERGVPVMMPVTPEQIARSLAPSVAAPPTPRINAGTRCLICGAYFDEAGLCGNGHERDAVIE